MIPEPYHFELWKTTFLFPHVQSVQDRGEMCPTHPIT